MTETLPEKLHRKKVAILCADMFERVELEEPRKALEDADAETEVVSIHDGEIQGLDHFEPARKRLTSWPTLETDIRNAGGEGVDEQVVVDDNLVTSRKPDDIPAFNEKMVEVFSGVRVST